MLKGKNRLKAKGCVRVSQTQRQNRNKKFMKSRKVDDRNLKTQETEFQISFFQFIQSWFLSLWYKLITCITCTPNVSQ